MGDNPQNSIATIHNLAFGLTMAFGLISLGISGFGFVLSVISHVNGFSLNGLKHVDRVGHHISLAGHITDMALVGIRGFGPVSLVGLGGFGLVGVIGLSLISHYGLIGFIGLSISLIGLGGHSGDISIIGLGDLSVINIIG
jgi:hypothetical protein